MSNNALTKIKELGYDHLYIRFNLYTREEVNLLSKFCIENGLKWASGDTLREKSFSKGCAIYIVIKNILKGSCKCLARSSLSYAGDSTDYVISVKEFLGKPKIKRGENI